VYVVPWLLFNSYDDHWLLLATSCSYYSVPVSERSIVISVSVCLPVCLVHTHISWTRWSNFTKYSVRVTCGHGSFMFWRRCDMFGIFSFVDDIMLEHNGQEQVTRKWRILHALTLLWKRIPASPEIRCKLTLSQDLDLEKNRHGTSTVADVVNLFDSKSQDKRWILNLIHQGQHWTGRNCQLRLPVSTSKKGKRSHGDVDVGTVVWTIVDLTAETIDRRWLVELECDIWYRFRQVVVATEAVEQQTDVDVGAIAVLWSSTQWRHTTSRQHRRVAVEVARESNFRHCARQHAWVHHLASLTTNNSVMANTARAV